jgi:hypothetical protein
LLNVTQLAWIGGQYVGNQYKLNLQYEIPKYIQTYGGYLNINFDENTSYVDITGVNGATYQYLQSLTIINENNQSLVNSLSYYQNSKPFSLQQINIKLCTTDSKCGSNITISTLRKSFYPILKASQVIQATTLNYEAISILTKDVSSLQPQALTNSLIVKSTAPVTNTISNYIYTFTMN